MPQTREAKRIEALDGLRGIAILAVVIHHVCKVPELNRWQISWNSVFSFGNFGSEFFLVISGFFMTKSLLKVKHHQRSTMSIIIRRYLRIAPLFYLAFLINALLLPWLTSQFIDKAKAIPDNNVLLLYVLGLANISVAINGYVNIFDVTWTLNVQDQFYLLWIPVFLYIPSRWHKSLCWSIIGITQIVRLIAADYYSEDVIHVLTPFRMDALLIGCLLAISSSQRSYRPNRFRIPITLIASATFLIILALFPYKGSHWFPRYGYPILGLLSLLWLQTGLAVDPTCLLGRILCSPWLRWYGQRSYAIFLFHLFVHHSLIAASWFIRHKVLHMQSDINHTYIQNFMMGVLTIPACIPVAWVLWKVIEEPFNRIRDRINRPLYRVSRTQRDRQKSSTDLLPC